MTTPAPWLRPPVDARRLSVDDVRRRCASLPAPGRVHIDVVAEPRPAALLVPLIDVDGEAAVVVTRRATTMVHHGDDWVFPGGRVEPSDATPAEAARREAAEELGLSAAEVEVVGRLTTRGPIVSGFLLDIFVGVIATDARLAPDPGEVAEVLLVTLSALSAEGAFTQLEHMPGHQPGTLVAATDRPGPRGPFGCFTLRPGALLWGLQSDILHELLVHVLAPLPSAPARGGQVVQLDIATIPRGGPTT